MSHTGYGVISICCFIIYALCAKIRMAQNTYSQYENGKIAWTAELLIKLSDYYHVSIDYLLDRTNDPTPYPPPRR